VEDARGSADSSRSSDSTTVAELATETRTSPDVVRDLYHQEVAAVGAVAKVKNFIGIIAGRRVRQRLLSLQKRGDI
jgi:hypothetical protein